MKDDYIIKQAEKEIDRYLGKENNSIPPSESLGDEVAEKNKYAAISWKDFLEQQDEDGDPWMIEGILRFGWLGVLGGHGKQGKTTLTIHLLNALRLGNSFITDTCPSPVIYINFEMSPYDLRDLVRDITDDFKEEGEAALIVNQPKVPLDLPWLEKSLSKQPKAGVCVIDSFRGAFLLSGDTENQAGTVGVKLRQLQNIARKTGWTILLIHHFRKSGKGDALDLAGSGEWVSAPDVILTWDRTNFLEAGTLKLTGRIPPAEPLAIDVTRKYFKVLGTTSFQEVAVQRQKVLGVLTSSWMSTEEVVGLLKEMPSATVRRHLKSLFTSKEVEREGKGVKGDSHRWRAKQQTVDSQETILKPCRVCKSKKFWRRADGGLVCCTCYPPVNEEMVIERVEVEA